MSESEESQTDKLIRALEAELWRVQVALRAAKILKIDEMEGEWQRRGVKVRSVHSREGI
jgi:hypothetical protein